MSSVPPSPAEPADSGEPAASAAPDRDAGAAPGGDPSHAGPATLRAIFAGRRGRLLIGLLAAEFGAAVQGIAYSSVLPIAARELHGASLYGATLACGTLATLLVLALGTRLLTRFAVPTTMLAATVLFVAGTVMTAIAPAMIWVLAGSAVRGAGAGLLAGLGYSALGALYEDRLRARVMGLFAMMWLLPSLLGPLANTAVASAFGWRWAMVWPAALVIVARLVMGRHISLVRLSRESEHVPVWTGLSVVAAIAVASVASARGGTGGAVVFGAALLVATVLTIVLFGHAAAGQRWRFAVMTAFFGASFVYFGGESVMSLAVLDGLHGTLAEGSIAVGAAGVTWSLVPFAPASWMRALRLDAPLTRSAWGLVVVAVGLVGVALVLMLAPEQDGGRAGVWPLIGAAALTGFGIGLSYQTLSAAGLDELEEARVAPVATATAFGETSATTLGAMLSGGVYSLAASAGVAPRPVLSGDFWGLAVAALATLVLLAAARRRALASGA